MSFQKNNWIHKSGSKKVGGKIYLPIEGKKILAGSSLDYLIFQSDRKEHINIMVEFDLEIDGIKTKYEELIEEYYKYLNELIIGCSIESASIDKHGSLEVIINSKPKINIFVDNEIFRLPSDKWDYNYPGGCIRSLPFNQNKK